MSEKKTFVMYKSWSPMIRSLPPEKAGELMIAICAYQDGDAYTFTDPVLSSIFEMMKTKFEEDNRIYEETCRKNSENGKKGGRPPKARETEEKRSVLGESDRFLEKAKKADNDNDYDNDSLKEKPSKEGKKKSNPIDDTAMSEPMKEKVQEWLRYKSERRENYKPTGLQTLVKRIAKEEQLHGTTAVMKLIDDSMSNGWRGIIWDRLDKPQYVPRAPTGQLTGFDALIAMEERASGSG